MFRGGGYRDSKVILYSVHLETNVPRQFKRSIGQTPRRTMRIRVFSEAFVLQARTVISYVCANLNQESRNYASPCASLETSFKYSTRASIGFPKKTKSNLSFLLREVGRDRRAIAEVLMSSTTLACSLARFRLVHVSQRSFIPRY